MHKFNLSTFVGVFSIVFLSSIGLSIGAEGAKVKIKKVKAKASSEKIEENKTPVKKRKKMLSGDVRFFYSKIAFQDNQTKTTGEVYSNTNMSSELSYNYNVYKTFYIGAILSASKWSFQDIPLRTFNNKTPSTLSYGLDILYYPSAKWLLKINLLSREQIYFNAANSLASEILVGRHNAITLEGMLRLREMTKWQMNSRLILSYDFSGKAGAITTQETLSQEIVLEFQRKLKLKNIAPKIALAISRNVANTTDYSQTITSFGFNFGANYFFQ